MFRMLDESRNRSGICCVRKLADVNCRQFCLVFSRRLISLCMFPPFAYLADPLARKATGILEPLFRNLTRAQ